MGSVTDTPGNSLPGSKPSPNMSRTRRRECQDLTLLLLAGVATKLPASAAFCGCAVTFCSAT